MALLRFGLLAILAVFFALPLLGPFVELARTPGSFAAWREHERIASLLGNSFALFALTSAIAVPWGMLWAVLVERIGMKGKHLLRVAVLFGIALPIPVSAVAWQAAFGDFLPASALGEAWRPWNQGLLPAVWIHAMIGLPWVIAIVSTVLRTTDPDLEEEANALGGVKMVWRMVIAPRLALALFAALAWLAVQTTTEIAVTDMMMVRTYAEEVYSQLVIDRSGIGASLALSVPIALVCIAMAFIAGNRWFGRYTRASGESIPTRAIALRGRWRRPAILFVWLTPLLFLGLPIAALVWRAAGDGTSLFHRLGSVVRTEGICLLTSMATAIAVGLVTAVLARRCCWAARQSRRDAAILFSLCAVLIFTPGPIAGFGLKWLIEWLIDVESSILPAMDFPPLQSLLFDQPSPLPIAWAATLRFFPLACLLQWPTLKAIPKEYLETAALLHRSPWRLVVAPASAEAFRSAIFFIAALTLGEVSAAKVVNPPFYSVYILRLFDQMHYGSESSVAALSLMQVFATGSLGVAWWLTRPISSAVPVPASSRSQG